MPEMMKILKISQGVAYRLRKELLKDYQAQKPLRDAQWGLPATGEKPSMAQQEEKTPQDA